MINGETTDYYPMVLLKAKRRRISIRNGSDSDIDCVVIIYSYTREETIALLRRCKLLYISKSRINDRQKFSTIFFSEE